MQVALCLFWCGCLVVGVVGAKPCAPNDDTGTTQKDSSDPLLAQGVVARRVPLELAASRPVLGVRWVGGLHCGAGWRGKTPPPPGRLATS